MKQPPMTLLKDWKDELRRHLQRQDICGWTLEDTAIEIAEKEIEQAKAASRSAAITECIEIAEGMKIPPLKPAQAWLTPQSDIAHNEAVDQLTSKLRNLLKD